MIGFRLRMESRGRSQRELGRRGERGACEGAQHAAACLLSTQSDAYIGQTRILTQVSYRTFCGWYRTLTSHTTWKPCVCPIHTEQAPRFLIPVLSNQLRSSHHVPASSNGFRLSLPLRPELSRKTHRPNRPGGSAIDSLRSAYPASK